ncbi:lipoprotein [Nitratidesulfovibrio vulgaris]|jgi:hypothetical protein|uniref:Lipoprotein, putative n=2 Tax=Nitratidesulfovibrio vulgaris TaxID=881 RepID=Q72FR6_NITV2|nr:lipoprotein [Nitratidesulfovibrio vulgaris]GEB81118.1 lipoprotein [Desulfovibrio desulfuricans]HBW14661.1 lipoprotein [Desulfovibrio sp.]AAS94631.1 lipoprotein, putative [Nitratidesulfovibrio vulgaris str. Hildenborough]ABM29831.1 lipoprotein, putative [Nitratidesulfovibrio vulgaris DP4]ADP85343.1 hypothetical protein Deval_0172 [Nitratidesulfovibrio vulgaris RCH1]
MSDYRHELARRGLVLTVNLLVVACVFLAMYRASLQPDEFTPVFCKTFFTALVPTLFVGWLGKRLLRNSRSEDAGHENVGHEERQPS